MAETIKVRLRAFAVHHGKRLRPGAIVDLSTDDFVNDKLPTWAETCDQTDREIMARYLSLGDADRIALHAQRAADKAIATANEAKQKADDLIKKSKEAAEVVVAVKVANEAKKKPSK